MRTDGSLAFAARPRASGCTALALVLALGSNELHAAPEAGESASDGEEDPAVSLSRAHFRSGLDAYEAERYDLAIEQWTQAYTLMGSLPELAGPRHVLALDLGQAHMRAYDRDGERSHLAAARTLLDSYVAWVDRPGHTLTEAEREDRPRALSLLARVESEGEAVPPARVASPHAIDRAPRRVPPPPGISPRAARGLVVAGGVSLGLTALCSLTLGLTMRRASRLERDYEMALFDAMAATPDGPPWAPEHEARIDEIDARGRATNRASLSMMVLVPLTAVVGGSLLAAGLVARQRHRVSARAVAIAPSRGGLALRF